MICLSRLALKSKAPNLFVAILLFTPGISLLFERGNFDSAIFLLVLLASWTLRKKMNLTTFFILVASTVFKFYTLPMLLVAISLMKISKVYKYFLLLITIFTALHLFKQLSELPKLPGTWFISFGAGVFAEYLNLVFRITGVELIISGILIPTLGLMIIAVSFFSYNKLQNRLMRSKIVYSNQYHDPITQLGFLCFVIFLSCYVSGISYDYRIIFYSVSLLGCPALWTLGKTKLRILVTFSVFFTTIFPPSLVTFRVVFQLFGDISMLIVLPILFGYYFEYWREAVEK
jgi:hypothetical protein